jgi:ribosomal protein S18 acetylase RimI-like enzyme
MVAGIEIRPVTGLLGRRGFVDLPFRLFKSDPAWVPPLRMSVYDRISPRHPANAHQDTALWMAYRQGRPVGRVGACVDQFFNEYQNASWGWVGFFESTDDVEAARALFDTACAWVKERGAQTAVGPASFTTNDELGLLVEGFDDPPLMLTTQNPPYYERLWDDYGWKQTMDLWAWTLDRSTVGLSERQRRTLARIRERTKLNVRGMKMSDFNAEVGRLFDVYNAAWSKNWGFAPMPEAEVRHLAKQLKQIVDPELALVIEKPDGEPVAVAIILLDVNELMMKIRSGRLLPTGWYRLLTGLKKVHRARIFALGVKPDQQFLALGPMLYQEMLDRLWVREVLDSAEASWILASNDKMNETVEAAGGRRTKTWRLYQLEL